MKYLVTGATGNIGSLVTKRLLDAGEMPSVLVRDAKNAWKLFDDRVEIRVGDLAGSRTDLTNVFQGCDTLFLVNTGPDLGERDRASASQVLRCKSASPDPITKIASARIASRAIME